MPGQVVDTESAQEFMRQVLKQIAEAELNAMADELELKHARFSAILSKARTGTLSLKELGPVLRSIFSTRRRVQGFLHGPVAGNLVGWIRDLLYSRDPIEQRFQTWCDHLRGVPDGIPYDLASELLHYAAPDNYWLWTRWIWDPRAGTGALPLVTMEGHDFMGRTIGETYLRVGEALAFVNETGRAAGFTRIGRGEFGLDVYLAGVYGIYVYTTVGMSMTKEFHRMIPPLPELCRRLLGVYKMEV